MAQATAADFAGRAARGLGREGRVRPLTTGEMYNRLDCNHPVEIHFQAQRDDLQSRVLGPFASFSAVDGVAYVENRILAFCDEQLRDWYSFDLGRHCISIIVQPA